MMKALIATLLFFSASAAFAYESAATNDAHVAYLNKYYHIDASTNKAANAELVNTELNLLEDVLNGTRSLKQGDLAHIACSNPACGGCSHAVCAVDDEQ